MASSTAVQSGSALGAVSDNPVNVSFEFFPPKTEDGEPIVQERVLTFSLGFGKRLFGFKRGETDGNGDNPDRKAARFVGSLVAHVSCGGRCGAPCGGWRWRALYECRAGCAQDSPAPSAPVHRFVVSRLRLR